MYSNIATIATATVISSLASLVPAQAGGATSAPSKYNNASFTASADQIRNRRRVQAPSFTITEFSSSSTRTSLPKR